MEYMELKQTLVDAIRMLERAGIFDFNGHYSARIPGTDHVLINSGKSVRSSLTIEDIVTINLDGQLIEGTDVPPMEYHIHTEIYKRRRDVLSVVHSHPRWSTFFSMTSIPLKPVIPQGALLGDVQVFPKVNSINTKQLGDELSKILADHTIVLMKSHGAVIVGGSIFDSFVLSAYLEENAYRQYTAAQLGAPYELNEEEIQECENNLRKPHLFKKVWDYYFSKL